MLLFLLGGCIETIEFDVERSGGRLIVDGTITDSPGPHILRLRRTSGQPKISDPLGGARVTIHDNRGNSETYYETTEGTYKLDGTTVRGVRGRTYWIVITLRNGSTYRSVPETMPLAVARDSIYHEFTTIETFSSSDVKVENEVMRVYKESFVPDTGDPLFLKWEFRGAYKFTEFDFPDPFNNPPRVCYVTENPNPQQIHLFDGSELSGGALKPAVIVDRDIDYAFYTRYYANLIQYSITQRAHQYWAQVDLAINQSGTIFDRPPANAYSNIYNVNDRSETVLGYFQAAAVDTTRFFVTQADVPRRIQNSCLSPNNPYCSDCLEIDNSSRQPPSYWLQD